MQNFKVERQPVEDIRKDTSSATIQGVVKETFLLCYKLCQCVYACICGNFDSEETTKFGGLERNITRIKDQ